MNLLVKILTIFGSSASIKEQIVLQLLGSTSLLLG